MTTVTQKFIKRERKNCEQKKNSMDEETIKK